MKKAFIVPNSDLLVALPFLASDYSGGSGSHRDEIVWILYHLGEETSDSFSDSLHPAHASPKRHNDFAEKHRHFTKTGHGATHQIRNVKVVVGAS